MTEHKGVKSKNSKLVVVSNRLPVVLSREENQWQAAPGSGGLVTALNPVLRDRGGYWIGWPGTKEDIPRNTLQNLLSRISRESGYRLVPLQLSEEEVAGYYEGFSNALLWPLFHDLQTTCVFRPEFWKWYRHVNGRFAALAGVYSGEEDYLWVHDYQLLGVARALKEQGYSRKTYFFLHIPFPSPDIFTCLPWRIPLLESLMDYDFIGFQTIRDRRNFTACLRTVENRIKVTTQGPISKIHYRDRQVSLGALPISIDAEDFEEASRSPEVEEHVERLREIHGSRKIILGVDRLDYTKGIPHRIEAFRDMLERYPELREKVTFIQVVVPSRDNVEAYRALLDEIERMVAHVNGGYTTESWVPLLFLYRSLSREELLGYYRLADMALVTPLKDGMNLVCKEYCACRIAEDGVLVLSEFAGAAAQFHRYALMTNPYDVEGLADTLVRGLCMKKGEQRRRMRGLRRIVKKRDIYWWVDQYLRASSGKELHNFPYTDLPPLGDMVLDQEALSGGEKTPSENLWDVMEDYSGYPETSGKLL